MAKRGTLLFALFFLAAPTWANGVVRAVGVPDSDIELLEHRIVGEVQDRIARITVEQVIHSRGVRNAEVIYTFTLPPDATITDVAMTMNGEWIDGSVLERGLAKRTYEAIVARRRDPLLVEQIDDERYRARVFPVPPKKSLRIRYTYQQVLPAVEGAVELAYLSAFKRLGGRVPKRVAGAITIRSPRDIELIEALSLGVEVTRDGTREATLHWNVAGDVLRDDLRIRFRDRREQVTFTLFGHRPSGADGTFLAILQPPVEVADGEVLPKDVIFVLDRSGSMGGDKMREAKAALTRGIDGLRAGDRFNILAFSTGVDSFRDRLVEVGADTRGDARSDARKWVSRIRAAGGTALDSALTAALKLGSRERLGIVALLTDGLPTVGVTDAETIVRRVEAGNGNAHRVFVFGVGLDQNARFLDRIAQVTRAKREDISRAEHVAPAMRRFYTRIQRPVMTDLNLSCSLPLTGVQPHPLPDLFAGDEVVVVGRYPKTGACRFTLTGRVAGRVVTHEFEGALPGTAELPSLPRFWAKQQVNALLAALAAGGSHRELVPAIRELGQKYSIITKFTAGLVLEPGTDVMNESGSDFEETAGEDGLSDTPFVGPTTNAAIGIGGFGNLRSRRGTAKVTQGVHKSLEWMVTQQDAQGGFGGVAETAEVLLAFLGAGFNERGSARDNPYARTVRNALGFLRSAQDAQGRFHRDLRIHLRATEAMAEAYVLTRNPLWKKPTQTALDVVRAARPANPDTPLVADIVIVYRLGRHAGLEMDPDMMERARVWLERKDALRTDRDIAAKLVATALLRGSTRGAWTKPLRERALNADREWASLAAALLGDKQRLAAFRTEVLARQKKDGSFGSVQQTARACRVLLSAWRLH